MATWSGSGPPANRAGTRHARSSESVLAGDCADALLRGLWILFRTERLGHVHDRPDEEFHLRREQTRVTNLLDEVEHVVSGVQPELRREQDNVVVLPETVRETLQDEDRLSAGRSADYIKIGDPPVR